MNKFSVILALLSLAGVAVADEKPDNWEEIVNPTPYTAKNHPEWKKFSSHCEKSCFEMFEADAGASETRQGILKDKCRSLCGQANLSGKAKTACDVLLESQSKQLKRGNKDVSTDDPRTYQLPGNLKKVLVDPSLSPQQADPKAKPANR